MDGLIANFPILAELVILLVVIGFGIQQIRAINRLQRERAQKEAAEKAASDQREKDAARPSD